MFLHHQAFVIEQQDFRERWKAEEKQGWQSCLQWRKAGEVLEEQNEYICLICMQVFQIVKLSIFPVTIPMRILDRKEISSMEYQVDLYVYISMLHITMYMHTHEYTHTNHQQAKTLTHNHTVTCTYTDWFHYPNACHSQSHLLTFMLTHTNPLR